MPCPYKYLRTFKNIHKKNSGENRCKVTPRSFLFMFLSH